MPTNIAVACRESLPRAFGLTETGATGAMAETGATGAMAETGAACRWVLRIERADGLAPF